jgi:hypothetical protein
VVPGDLLRLLLAQDALVTSVDLSSAAEANAQNFPISARHRVAQADALALRFPPCHWTWCLIRVYSSLVARIIGHIVTGFRIGQIRWLLETRGAQEIWCEWGANRDEARTKRASLGFEKCLTNKAVERIRKAYR